MLSAHVLLAHVDDTFEAEARTHGRRGYAVLARPGLRDDAPLAEPPREDRLPEGIVQLVRTRVQEILALQIQPLLRREPLRTCERRRPPRERPAEMFELCAERVVRLGGAPTCVELVEGRDERLGDVAMR